MQKTTVFRIKNHTPFFNILIINSLQKRQKMGLFETTERLVQNIAAI